MDVGGWLRSLGLGQYEAVFRDNAIDADVVADLTDGDLEKLGLPLGDRKRLLKAIAGLVGLRSAATKSEPAHAHPPHPPSAERRPITVMFCDLVDSTSLAAKLDAEDWHNLVGAYLDEASAAVTDFGGHVLKKLGDGLMALFGYPHAQENDAERAVRAALAIQRALADLNARNAKTGAPALAARVGLDMGPVVVDAAGEVFGDAPNVAARVQSAAEPGTVLVTARVQRQTAGLFVVEDRGAHHLKGVPAPVALYRIVRASGGRRGGARILTPLVGREDELFQLQRRWSRALEGEGQFVQIVGEPGIGKSRLIEEFRAKLVETPHTWVEWAASQLLQNTPLHPLAEWGRLRFGGADATDEGRLADLENTLGLIGIDAAEYAPLLAPLVDIPLREERRAKLPPEEMRRRQLAAMTAWVLAGARTQPAVLAFEDLHWADPTSLDLMARLVERGAQSPLLVVATTRPEFRAPWAMRSHHGVVSLAPLDRAQVRRMVGEIANRHALSDETIDGVGERTGGVPLFVEEVTRLLLERDAQGGAQAIPPTLQQSLAARLDRLGEAREVAQIAAVLGRDFSYRLLSDVSSSAAGFDELRLQAGLDRLTEADLLFADGAPPAAAYRFKHALIQDAAYDSLLKSRRQALHRRAAEALRDANAEPEAIAHHFTEAGLYDLAIEWWGKAGDQALRRSAFQEAIAHLGKAIAMADKAADGKVAGDSGQRQQLHAAYGNALFAARGPGAPETTGAFARARESVGDKDAFGRLAADYGLWVGSFARGELSPMRAHAATFLSDVEARPDSPEAGIAHRVQGATHWFAGEFLQARQHIERALALFQPGRDDDLAFRFGIDAGVGAMLYLALTLWPLGDIGRAISVVRDAEARSASLDHIGTRAHGKRHVAMFELMRGDPPRCALNALELARLTGEHDLPMWGAWGVFLEGLATAESGMVGGGLEAMRRGAELLREQNVLPFDGLQKIVLAEAEARAGDVDRAVVVLDEALATCERTGHRAFEAELHRVRGRMLLKRDPANPAPAEEALQTALAIAKEQGARSWGLRAALALAKLYQSTARAADAHAVLAPALQGFAPTPEMREIAEAQALLATLVETDDVKAEAGQRRRRLDLQTSYGRALLWAKGFAAEETKAAFARVQEIAGSAKEPAARFAIHDAECLRTFIRGEYCEAQEIAETMLREAGADAQSPEAGAFRCMLGLIRLYQGELKAAQTIFEQELTEFQFRPAGHAKAAAFLALTEWHLGEVARARQHIQQAVQRAGEVGDVATVGTVLFFETILESRRDDASATRLAADALLELSEKHGMRTYLDEGRVYANWARGRLLDPDFGADKLEQALADYTAQGNRADAPSLYCLLAELQADAGGPKVP